MAVKNTPIAIGGAGLVHDAADFRQAVVAGFAGTSDMKPAGGIIPGWGAELAVSVGTGLQVVVGSGLALIPAPDAAEGGWIVPNDANLALTLAVAHPSNARIDRVIARVSDSTITSHAGADNVAAIEVVTGTASGTPALPVIPTSKGAYLELRRIAVPAGASSLDPGALSLPPGGVPYVTGVGGTTVPAPFTPVWSASGFATFSIAETEFYRQGRVVTGFAYLVSSGGVPTGNYIVNAPVEPSTLFKIRAVPMGFFSLRRAVSGQITQGHLMSTGTGVGMVLIPDSTQDGSGILHRTVGAAGYGDAVLAGTIDVNDALSFSLHYSAVS